ncbi:hypothetical protein PEC18_30720 [Paucibacter sp. O1-1]|nr:hypothetical protein [Paucibacter sp. O1-1]MDA3830082.1 hypothetical protein [Paucibacter sp. O1-1]
MNILFYCPSHCDWSIASIDRLVNALMIEHVGFAAQRLVDDTGLLVDSSGVLSELSTQMSAQMPTELTDSPHRYSANDSRKCFVKAIDFAIGTATACRKYDLSLQSIPSHCQSIEDVLFYWQLAFKQQGRVGLEVKIVKPKIIATMSLMLISHSFRSLTRRCYNRVGNSLPNSQRFQW